jgi:two-component system, chemotaxis family, response regulator Rcp1
LGRRKFVEHKEVLLVEDNPGDALLVKKILQESSPGIKLHIVGDGKEALDFLHKKGVYAEVSYPALIILDLNLPKLNGFDVLLVIKNDKELTSIPVIVFSSSTNESDIQRTYDLHANCYISKPIEFEDFLFVIKEISNFWLRLAKLPYAKEG